MDRDNPEPQIFDPAQSPTPFLPDVPPGGGLVVLIVAVAAATGDWAERTALALAAGWAEKKRRILLADLALARPGLHQVLGTENGEGMSDAFLFGSSVLRVVRPVREGGFLFVPAGTATASPEAVATSPRWASVVDACDRISATAVVFLPADLPGGEHLLAQASDVFLLTDTGAESSRAHPVGIGDRLRGVLVPPLEVGLDVQDETQESVDDFGFLEVEPSLPESAAETLSGMDLDPALQEPEAGALEPDPISDEAAASVPGPRASRARVLVLILVVALMALVAAAWYGLVEVPWLSSRLLAPDAGIAQDPVASHEVGGEGVAYLAGLLERHGRSPE